MEKTTRPSDTPNAFRLCEQQYIYVDGEALPDVGTGFHVLHNGAPVAYVFCANDPKYVPHFFIYKLRDAQLTEMVAEQDLYELPTSSAVLLLSADTCTLYAPVMEDVELSDRTSLSDPIQMALSEHFRTQNIPQKVPVDSRLSIVQRIISKAVDLLFSQNASSGSK